VFKAFTGELRITGGVSLAVGGVSPDGAVRIVAGSRANGPAVVRLFNGVADPKKLFTFVAGNPEDMGGVQVAAGYLAPSSVPSYLPNLITSAESGQQAVVV
jgi:hypothetical protein